MYCGSCLIDVTSQPIWVSVAIYREAGANGSSVVSTGYKPYLEITKIA
jgi:hypothetical protein